MHFTIPARFKNEFIFLAVLFGAISPESLTPKILREKLRSFEFLEEYEQNVILFKTKHRKNIADKFRLKFHINEKGKFSTVGTGRAVFIRILNTRTVFTDPLKFFYTPDGLSFNGSFLTRLDEILNHLNNQKLGKSRKRRKVDAYVIEPCPFKSGDFASIEEKFNASINIYSKCKNDDQNEYLYSTLRIGQIDQKYNIDLHYQKESGSFVMIHNKEKYFQNLLKCPNAGCRFSFSKRNKYLRHLKFCTNILSRTKIKVKQHEVCNSSELFNKARKYGLIRSNPACDNFIFYDIESALPKSNIKTAKSKVLSTHHIISLAVNAYVNGMHKSKVWTVKDSSEGAQIELLDKFIDFIYDVKKEISIDIKLRNDIKKLTELSKCLAIRDFDLDEISTILYALKQFEELNIFGFNNSRYDNKIIFPLLMQALDKRALAAKDISILKKGTAYFSIKFDGFAFKDLMHFSSPCSLDKYMQTWLKDQLKLLFPYELFQSIEDVRKCIDFPKIDAFRTSLKPDVDVQLYEKCKDIYNMHHSLPETNKNFWPNFEYYLRYYNLADVEPASRALIIQFNTYKQNFGINPLIYFGLPSFSRAAMLKLYDNECPSIFTFPDEKTVQVFRSEIIGGLTNCYHRHITTDSNEKCSDNAKFNKHGKKWDQIIFFDVNSMYPSTFRNKFPCGLGFQWVKSGNILKKSLMTTKKISIESIQWIDYVGRTDPRLVSKSGKRVKIISGWAKREHKIGYFYVDGYAKVDGKEIVFEYDGCRYHACEICKIENIAKNDNERDSFLKSLNIQVVRMQGCQWAKLCKTINLGNSKISPILFENKISEEKLINLVGVNKVYGFMVIDISPTLKAQKFLDVNWPPLIFKANISKTDLPESMQLLAQHKEFPNTIVQGMRKKDILLHTDQIYYLIKNGFHVSKIHTFYEYEGARCLKPIFDAVYEARVQATTAKDSLKATAVKLVSNSMYGQMLMASV